jgi:hypothetical protein
LPRLRSHATDRAGLQARITGFGQAVQPSEDFAADAAIGNLRHNIKLQLAPTSTVWVDIHWTEATPAVRQGTRLPAAGCRGFERVTEITGGPISLLPDTEIAEDHVEQILDIDGTGDTAETAQSQAEIFCAKLGQGRTERSPQRQGGFL